MSRDFRDINTHHQNNLKRSIGQRVGNNSVRYEYITSKDELINSYLHRMDDLGYPLRVEPKRDRYVVNKKALQDALENATTEALKQMDKEITEFIYTEVREMIEDNVQDILNGINVVNNNFIVKASKPSKSHSMKFIERFGKALGKAIADIVDDIFFPKHKY